MAARVGDGGCSSGCEMTLRDVSAALDNSASLLWPQEICGDHRAELQEHFIPDLMWSQASPRKQETKSG